MVLLFSTATFIQAQVEDLYQRFLNPKPEAHTKVWWFHGETETTKEGIDADLRAFKEKGVGGVVFYDQVHSQAEGAFDAMSPQWWEMLKYAALRAKELGLSFEVAVSNGYVAGGPWITPELGMQQIAMADSMITVKKKRTITMRLAYPRKNFHDIATLLFPDKADLKPISILSDSRKMQNNESLVVHFDAKRKISVSSISYVLSARGKGSSASMNIPGKPQERYFGAGYIDFPPIGELEYSVDGKTWLVATKLLPLENVIGHKTRERTINFPQVKGRFFRLRIHDWMDAEGKFPNLQIENVRLTKRDMIDNWQVKTGFRTEVMYPSVVGEAKGALKSQEIQNVTSLMNADGTITLTLEPGTWHLMRFGYVPTGARTKHGRKNLLGLEANVMSAEAVRTHYKHYFGAICDTLTAIGCKPKAMHMDSHEAGIQNWTRGFEKTFSRLRGYDIISLLPALSGYIVDNRDKTEKVLLDFRKSIAETIGQEFYGTFAKLCHADGVEYVSQAMLNIETDNIYFRGFCDKPQGEFWGYQKNGNFDCLDAASASHLYGHSIASAEAFTDSPYKSTWDELLRIANLAYCRGINEFVVCASSYQPWLDRKYDDSNSLHPYIFHRLNPNWNTVGQFWNYQARCSQLLQEGKPVIDLCVYLGEDTPLKTMAYKLPVIPEGYNFDVCTFDALMHRFYAQNGLLAVKGGMTYKALVIQDRTYLSPEALQKIRQLEQAGVNVIWCNRGETVENGLRQAGIVPDLAFTSANEPDDKTYFYHRQINDADIYFIYNHSNHNYNMPVTLRTKYGTLERWNTLTKERQELDMNADKTVQLCLKPYESVFLVAQ